MVRFARALPRLRERGGARTSHATACRASGARLRRPAARPRLLPDRLRGLRRGERHLRPRDDAQAPRDRRRATRSRFDYEAKGGQRRRAGDRRPRGRADRRARSSAAAAAATSCSPTSERGRWVDVKSADINEYVKEATGGEFSAKDFRTWSGTVLAAVALAVSGPAPGTEDARASAPRPAPSRRWRATSATRRRSRRASYIDPRVFDRFDGGLTIAARCPSCVEDTPTGRTSSARSRRPCWT